MRKRHVPQRTCVICGAKTTKRELIRVVRTPDGACLVDETGKRAGRGAYLCRQFECWRRAFSTNRLAHSLRGEIAIADRERLAAFGSAMSIAEEAAR